jgi:hypothetical protein
MNRTAAVCMTVLSAGVVVIGNAVATEQFCTGHPHSWSCDNPIAPGPDLPEETAAQSSTSLIYQTFTFNI